MYSHCQLLKSFHLKESSATDLNEHRTVFHQEVEVTDQMTEVRRWIEIFVAAIVATAALLLLAVLIRRPRHRLPPGPLGWPIFGSLLSLGKLPHQSLYKLSKQYGPLMFIRLGSVKTLVVTSPEMAEEILRAHDQIMSSRPVMTVAQVFGYGQIDIAWSAYGQYWRYVRKICTVGLLTAARISQFRKIREREVLATLHFILEESQRGSAVNMAQCFSNITTNNITQIMMNKSYCVLTAGSKPAVVPGMPISVPEALQEMFVLSGAFNISDYVPLLKPFDLQGLQKRAKHSHKMMDSFFQNVIEEHRQGLSTATPENYKEDFVDALLGIGKTKEFQEQLSMDSIKAILLDMIAAGADTSSVLPHWALTELMRHPKVMSGVQEELDSVVGPYRLVQEDDLPKLKYLHAVVKETFRLHPPAPLLLPHESTHDCEIRGFHIPAKTQVLVNLWGVHNDPAVWERPLEFDPDRFLNSNVDFKGQDFEFLPFGSGRRMCPGLNLGLVMVLYPLALLLHAVDWKTAEGQDPRVIDMSELFGLVLYKRLPLTVYGKARMANHVIYPAQQAQK